MIMIALLAPILFLQGETTTSEDTIIFMEESTTTEPTAVFQYEECVEIVFDLLCSLDCNREHRVIVKEAGLLGALVKCLEKARELGEESGSASSDTGTPPPSEEPR